MPSARALSDLWCQEVTAHTSKTTMKPSKTAGGLTAFGSKLAHLLEALGRATELS